MILKTFKTALVAVFLLTAHLTGMAKQKARVDGQPDFAYPKTVAASAEKNMSSPDHVEALRAMLNYTVAENLIDSEKVFQIVNRIDSLSAGMPAPYSAIGYLIEAEIYLDIFTSDAYNYNSRIENEGFDELNPQYWNHQQFAGKIRQLVTQALSQKDAAEKMPLSQIDKLLDASPDFKDYTVYDFIVYKTIYLTSPFESEVPVIPFYKTESGSFPTALELIDSLLEVHNSPSLARTTATLYKFMLLPEGENNEFLWQQILRNGNSPYNTSLMIYLYNRCFSEFSFNETKAGDPDYHEFFNIVASMKNDITIQPYKDKISDLYELMTLPSVNISFPVLIETGKPFDVKSSISNLNEYYLLLLEVPETTTDYIRIKNIHKAKIIDNHKITESGTIPFHKDIVSQFTVSKPGRYIVVVSRSKDMGGLMLKNSDYTVQSIKASDIDLLVVNPYYDAAYNAEGCFVLNSKDSSPIPDVKVEFKPYPERYGQSAPSIVKTTNAEGFAQTDTRNGEVYVEFNGSNASSYVNRYSQKIGSSTRIQLYASQPVYRPGDKIEFLGIAYRDRTNNANLIEGLRVKVILEDANYTKIDTLECVSDKSGRFTGEFNVPNSGLLGMWHLRTQYERENDDTGSYVEAGNLPIEVAEYRIPSFIVTVDKDECASDSLCFKGNASTYSGMPVSFANVNFTISYHPDYYGRWYGYSEQSYSSTSSTDASGNFYIKLPLDNIEFKKYRGTFLLVASVTDGAGETVESSMLPFWLSDNFNLTASIPDKIDITDSPQKFEVRVTDQAGLPVIKEVEYQIIDEKGKEISAGVFESPLLSLSCSNFTEGRYVFKFNIKGIEDPKDVSYTSILYRSAKKDIPIDTCLWVPKNTFTVPAFAVEVAVPYGGSIKGQHILCIISDSEGGFSYRWLTSSGQMESLKINPPQMNSRTYVDFYTYKEHKIYNEKVTLIPEEQTYPFTLKTETFRSAISAGDKENWKFTITQKGVPVEGYAFALLYDKALDAISPLNWPSTLFRPNYPQMIHVNIHQTYNSNSNFTLKYIQLGFQREPDFSFQLYGYSLYTGGFGRYPRPRLYANESVSRSVPQMEMKMESMAMAEEAMPTAAYDDAGAYDNAAGAIEEGSYEDQVDFDTSEEVKLRPVEMPVAFFRPLLSSDNRGNVTIDFIVPNFNTTWNLVMGAYDSNLNSCQTRLETVASKKVMVSMANPRFIRTGDKAVLKATVYNNTAEEIRAYGSYEIFNPVSGEIIQRQQSAETKIKPSGNFVFETEFNCPSDINFLGLRVYGISSDCSDGEETVIPVLPSSQPVVDSYPFYLQPEQNEFRMKVPGMPNDAVVTFTYCDNPSWEILTALAPSVNRKNASLNSQLESLYSACVSLGLLETNETLRNGLKMIINGEAGDSLLVSALKKNQDLKIVAVENTPWVNDANSEALNLARLSNLLDLETAENQIEECWNKITLLRNPDGGLSWCPGMESSIYMTQQFLLYLGMLQHKGYLPELDNYNLFVNSAFRYCEKEFVKEYNKLSNKSRESYLPSLYKFLYIKSLYPDVKVISEFAGIYDKAIKSIDKNWKKLNIEYKAEMALVAYRNGNKKLAKDILDSLSEYASTSSEGTYFANLDSYGSSAGKISTTASVLSAFGEIEPDNRMVEGLCQWLLMQKQAQNWNKGTAYLEAADALLKYADEWIQPTLPPVITIDGHIVDNSRIDRLTGSCKIDISDANAKDAEISISRDSSGPAWGGVIGLYVQPMEEITPGWIESLKIEKTFMVVSDEDGNQKAKKSSSLSTGDLVRITLVIESEKDMDFVVISDERASCLEPRDQLSGYVGIDNLWCYREIKNSVTNLYIPYLPKGRHLLSYDCYVSEEGLFASGIAAIQCLNAPVLSAHSGGKILKVK